MVSLAHRIQFMLRLTVATLRPDFLICYIFIIPLIFKFQVLFQPNLCSAIYDMIYSSYLLAVSYCGTHPGATTLCLTLCSLTTLFHFSRLHTFLRWKTNKLHLIGFFCDHLLSVKNSYCHRFPMIGYIKATQRNRLTSSLFTSTFAICFLMVGANSVLPCPIDNVHANESVIDDKMKKQLEEKTE